MDLPLTPAQLNTVTAYVAKVTPAGEPVPVNTDFIATTVYAQIQQMRNDLRNDFLAAFMLRFQSLSPADRALVNTFMLSKPVDPTQA